MSAQPAIDPATDRPRWTPIVVPGVADPAAAPRRARRVAVRAPATPSSRQVGSLRPATRASAWRRRAGAVAVLVLLAFLVTVLVGRVTAGADLADPVGGAVTVAPGQTLWDVAAATAPAGVDTRDQLARIVELNGLSASDVDAWTVVLVPAG